MEQNEKLLRSFDLEIYKRLDEGQITNWPEHAPLGVACAGFGQGQAAHNVYHCEPTLPMTRAALDSLVDNMLQMQEQGFLFCTWNGASFDFRVLALETGRFQDCSKLALRHCDMMLLCVWGKGWMAGLDKALRAHQLEPKKSIVTLSEGTPLEGMDGSKFPALWQAGELGACMQYFHRDLAAEYELARAVTETKRLRFYNKAFTNVHTVNVEKMWTVEELLEGKMGAFPDTSWQDRPIQPEQFTGWINRN